MDARRLKILAAKIVSLGFLAVVSCTVIAQGLRTLSSYVFAWKFSSVPGFGFLKRWQGWHRLDLANVTSVGLVFLEYIVLVTAVRYFLVPGAMSEKQNWNHENERTLSWTGFVVVVVGEAALFFLGVMNRESGWDEGASVPVALVGSLLYTAAIVFVAYVTVRLQQRS